MDKRATKRKRVVLTIEDKLKVCRLAKQNVPKFVLMNQFKIGKSTLNDILRSFLIQPNAYPVKILEKGCPT